MKIFFASQVSPALFYSALLFSLLVPLSVVDAQTNAQQKREQRKELKIKRALDKLAKSKAVFDNKRLKLKQQVLQTFTNAINAVDASTLRIDERTRVVKELKLARNLFQTEGELEKIPAFQNTFVNYIGKSLSAYSDLMKAYEKAMKNVPRTDRRYEQLELQIAAYDEDVNSTDAFQAGSVWKGYRSDFDWGPGYKVEKGEGSLLRLTKFRNDRVDVSFQLEVLSREGDEVVVEISQNDKRFIAIAEGTFDGISLNIAMTSMKKGMPRYFQYSGKIAGNLGMLGLRGRKTNGAHTTGKIVLEAVE